MLEKIHKRYVRTIYPKVRHLRGFTRLKLILEELLKHPLETVSEEDIKDIFEQEWKGLVLIDSCRQDFFEEVTGYKGKRISKGSNTPDYIRKNFASDNFEDIVYITANPQFGDSRFNELTGKKPEEVFHSVFRPFLSDWDEEDNTVKGDPVIRDLKTAIKLFPEKKFVVHFLQPHQPFLSKNFGTHGLSKNVSEEKKISGPINIWNEAEKGNYDKSEVIEGYKDNIRYIEEFIEIVNEEIEGKTYLTSDHGNFVDDNGLYGHEGGREEKALREVPWVKIND